MSNCPLGLNNDQIDILMERGDIEKCSNCSLLKMEYGIIHCELCDSSEFHIYGSKSIRN